MVAPKKRKDGMPKKHDPKKKERQGMIRERKPLPQGDCMTCFSMDPLFDFTIYGMQVCPVLILP